MGYILYSGKCGRFGFHFQSSPAPAAWAGSKRPKAYALALGVPMQPLQASSFVGIRPLQASSGLRRRSPMYVSMHSHTIFIIYTYKYIYIYIYISNMRMYRLHRKRMMNHNNMSLFNDNKSNRTEIMQRTRAA